MADGRPGRRTVTRWRRRARRSRRPACRRRSARRAAGFASARARRRRVAARPVRSSGCGPRFPAADGELGGDQAARFAGIGLVEDRAARARQDDAGSSRSAGPPGGPTRATRSAAGRRPGSPACGPRAAPARPSTPSAPDVRLPGRPVGADRARSRGRPAARIDRLLGDDDAVRRQVLERHDAAAARAAVAVRHRESAGGQEPRAGRVGGEGSRHRWSGRLGPSSSAPRWPPGPARPERSRSKWPHCRCRRGAAGRPWRGRAP